MCPPPHLPACLPACSRHGILIVEDDPYFYLQFPRGPQHPPGLAGLPRASSYLSLDTQGRVIRLDSFAKFLAPGLRLGWAAAPPTVIDKLAQVMQAQTLGASGVSQVRQGGWGMQDLLLQGKCCKRRRRLQAGAGRRLRVASGPPPTKPASQPHRPTRRSHPPTHPTHMLCVAPHPHLLQAITAEMLGAWGEEGLHSHLVTLQAQYAAKAAALHGAAQRELAGLAEWQEPRAGMFMVGAGGC